MKLLLVFSVALAFASCSASKKSFNPDQVYPVSHLQSDYQLFQKILENAHPGLYWYTPKDSMDYYFSEGYQKITAPMTEPQFRTLLSYVIAKINCGHTATKYSKNYSEYLQKVSPKMFPLSVKVWKDTMVVTANLNRQDSVLQRGTVILGINGIAEKAIVDSLVKFLPSDGFNETATFQQLSNRGNFGAWYRNVFGLTDTLQIAYLNKAGLKDSVAVRLFEPGKDTARREPRTDFKFNRDQQLFSVRNLQIDTVLNTGFMSLNSFSRGNKLNSFFKKSFRALKKNHTQALVIDVRSNGGGDAGLAAKLTRYLIEHSFKVGDSLYAIRRSTPYGGYIKKQLLYWLAMHIVTRKHQDGNYHFGYFERHIFKPIKKDHFDGEVYILIGGNSFSATTLFAGQLKGQKNVTLVGEETGGAAYGNTAWMIPDARLPNTGIEFRLPKFRLVIDKNAVKNGRGVMPDVWVGPTVNAIQNGIDYKVEKVRELILKKQSGKFSK